MEVNDVIKSLKAAGWKVKHIKQKNKAPKQKSKPSVNPSNMVVNKKESKVVPMSLQELDDSEIEEMLDLTLVTMSKVGGDQYGQQISRLVALLSTLTIMQELGEILRQSYMTDMSYNPILDRLEVLQAQAEREYMFVRPYIMSAIEDHGLFSFAGVG